MRMLTDPQPDRRPRRETLPSSAAADKKNGPLRGHSCVGLLVFLVAMLADHDAAIASVVTPAAVPAVVARHANFGADAIFGTRTVPVMMVAVALDHDGLGARHRRQSNRERAQRSGDITKLPHDVLLTLSED